MSFFFYFCAILKLQLILKDENDFDLGDELVACNSIKSKSRPLRFVEGLSTASQESSQLSELLVKILFRYQTLHV